MEKIIPIPKVLPDSHKTYNILADLQYNIINCEEDSIILDFSDCIFSHALFTSFIGALAVLAKSNKKKLTYRAKEHSKLYKYIMTSGLYSFLTADNQDHTNKYSIPFTEIKMNEDSVIDYTNSILELAPIQLTEKANEVLFNNIYELFINAYDHSKATNGVYACGNWMPQKHELVFSVYDTGIGIPPLVKTKVDSSLSSKETILWSLTNGNSTKQLVGNTPRGIGLANFKNFIEINNGYFSIVSNDICYIYNSSEKFYPIQHPIVGTIISFIIRSDSEHVYTVKQK